MDKKYALDLILGNEYYAIDDLRYNRKVGIMLSKDAFSELLAIKDEMVEEHAEWMKELPLKTFNSKHCFYVNGPYLLSLRRDYMRLLISDYQMKDSYLFNRNAEDMTISRLSGQPRLT